MFSYIINFKREGIIALSETHLDAKIKQKISEDVEARTLCMCNGGYLVNCYYDTYLPNEKIATISGFSYRVKKFPNANFGVLIRRKFPENIDPIAMQLGIIQAVNQASGHGGTIVQRYEDFVARIPTNEDSFNKIVLYLPCQMLHQQIYIGFFLNM
ncbi:hypothetical protein P9D90_13430 [Bacillus mojavensis]|uniref:hypothetical protein n=1 Tax=Bacillus mojavensis TaxID=72360 RepID=UPI002DB9CB29|nr:hypothetical protein [Bacillus mojavensis]MEC1796140.1 hypothetical protein [Bacillus mojavensis]